MRRHSIPAITHPEFRIRTRGAIDSSPVETARPHRTVPSGEESPH